MGTVGSRKGHCALVASIIAFAPLAANVFAADLTATTKPDTPRFNVRIANEKAAAAVRTAITGAYERLGSPSCQQVFSDFNALDGTRLDEVLAAAGRNGQGFLRLVMFYDGSRRLHCHKGDPYAITQPGSRVVFICPRKFLRKQERNPVAAEAIIIHEMLHTLGLGENPPSSEVITAGVLDRCG